MSLRGKIIMTIIWSAIAVGLTIEVLVWLHIIEPIYHNCRNEIEGWTCDLQGYRWVK